MKSAARQARRRYLRYGALQLSLLFALAVVLGRAFHLQLYQGEVWRAKAIAQHEKRLPLPAPRGAIYDRAGRELVVSHTTYQISVATVDLADRRSAARALQSVLDLRPETARRIAAGERSWIQLPGKYTAQQVETLEGRIGRRGLHIVPMVDRAYPRGQLAAEILGRVDVNGRGQSGLELSFDSLLAGQPGIALRRTDGTGASAGWLEEEIVAPAPGADIYLTIDAELQAIAESVLEEAVDTSGAAGGDLLVVEPSTGEILAATSRRMAVPAHLAHLAAVTEPFEAGSTLKPFTAAALLAEGLAKLTDAVDTGRGVYRTAGRTVHDEKPFGRLTLSQTLAVSSNVGMARFAERLPAGVQFSYLRGFGFGMPAGITYPSESGGVLRPLSEWSAQSRASHAIGYEVAVTPLQLVMAYGAIANGGLLMRPQMAREARNGDGSTRWVARPEMIRRVIPGWVAAQMREALVQVVTKGTGQSASVPGLAVAGKTGTAWRFDRVQGYGGRSYTSSFVGLVPADEPRLVILVKLDKPSGAYQGGLTAAPVMSETVRAALAGSYWSAPPLMGETEIADEQAVGSAGQAPTGGPYVFALDRPLMRARDRGERPKFETATALPDVRGLAMRDAVRQLHAAGWRVIVRGGGRVESTEPAVSTRLRRGEHVVLLGSGRSPPGASGRKAGPR